MKRLLKCLLLLLCCCLFTLLPVKVTAADKEYRIFDDFRTTDLGASNVFSSSFAVGKRNVAHALLPAKAWGDPVDTGSGYVIYKLSAPEGEEMHKVEINLVAKVSHLSKGEFVNNNLKVYGSIDGSTYTMLSETKAEGGGEREIQTVTTCSPCLDYYVKLEMNNVEGRLPLAQVGVKIFSVEISYTTQESNLQRPTLMAVDKAQYADVENFVGGESTADGVRLHSDGYYVYPLQAKDGVVLTFTGLTLHDLTERDNWFSVALLGQPQAGNYARRNCRGLYFMFFRKEGQLLYNLTYNDGSKDIHLGNGMSLGEYTEEIQLCVSRLGGSVSPKLNITVNGVLNTTAKAQRITGADIANSVGETYLCYGGYGDTSDISPSALHSAVLSELSYPDLDAPTLIFIDECKERYTSGLVSLPEYTFFDESQISFARVRLYKKEGTLVLLTDGRFVASKGEYLWVFEVEDEWGNFRREVVLITIE